MPIPFIPQQRLLNQGIAVPCFKHPQEVVKHLVAMQAQEYAQAKWAIGLRLQGSTDAKVELALTDGAILRTHVMRPTWHFVAPADIRWLLALTAPRVHAFNASYYRKMELDDAVFRKSEKVLINALQGGKFLTRTELQAALATAKIQADGLRLGLIMMHAELDGLICSGPREGKQFAYALLEERVPPFPTLDHDEALGRLSARYFATRGPATLHDFAWWSGLSIKDARDGAAMLPKAFEREMIGDKEYIFTPENAVKSKAMQTTILLPDYDEYGISYKDRSALYSNVSKQESAGFPHMLIVDGVEGGRWRRVTSGGKLTAETSAWNTREKTKAKTVKQAISRYEAFANNVTQ